MLLYADDSALLVSDEETSKIQENLGLKISFNRSWQN